MDQMVFETQKWLNDTYGNDTRFKKLDLSNENIKGKTGWTTIYALTRALQIELGITNTADNFGPSTIAKFNVKFPNGILQQKNGDTTESNVYGIIQGALWCKGYSAGSETITKHFYTGTANGIKKLKNDMGIGGNSTVTLEIMKALLSMQQFVLLDSYGGKSSIRTIQQEINRTYRDYTGIIPSDGLYGREMNKALIQVLQAIEGYSPSEATGHFGDGTKGKLKTISAVTASGNPKWVWLANVMLLCNGYTLPINDYWTDLMNITITRFQKDYALPTAGIVDTTTWMSLFLSKGDPSRAAKACDTRFEITSELALQLKKDGYQIIGRYLTGGDFKEIRAGELQRILDNGLNYFPIFQENGRELSDFSYQYGRIHGKLASEAALSKGVPSTVIYFAVDLDVYDYQIDSNIIPYFKGVNETISIQYEVGIYASRNVCNRVFNAGYAISSFVSDMSTGFSGNLGFPIPKNWNYDQFHEISGYGGKWDLDKVAYANKVPACSSVKDTTDGEYQTYTLPSMYTVEELASFPSISEIFSIVSELENTYKEYTTSILGQQSSIHYTPQIGALQYLARRYYLDDCFVKGIGFALVSSIIYDADFDLFMQDKSREKLKNSIEEYLSLNLKDKKNGVIDLGHLAITTLSYYNFTINPSSWNGWAGDLVSAYSLVRDYYQKYPNEDLNTISRAYIGGEHPEDDLPSQVVSDENKCNYTDLCSDGYAIVLAKNLKNSKGNLSTAFKTTFIQNVGEEFNALLNDIGVTNNIQKISEKVESVVKATLADLLSRAENGFTDSPESVKKACVNTFAKWLHFSL